MGHPVALALSAVAVGVLVPACVQSRDPETIACTPGERVVVGCGACGVGACIGDPVIRVCDGSSDVRACADAIGILGESDDACGSLCPAARVTCPEGGAITVVHRAFRDEGYECAWDVGPAPAAE